MSIAEIDCRGCRSTGRTISQPSPAMTWQIHVYGTASGELAAWCAGDIVPLHVFEWRPEHEAAGLARDAIYLIRPDTFVAIADTSGAPKTLNRYCADHWIRLLAP